MKPNVEKRIGDLAKMGVAELQQEHRHLFGQEPASAHRQFLFRRIAWELQAREEGRLPGRMRHIARAIAQDAPLRSRVITNAEKRRAGIPLDRVKTTTIAPDHDSRLPMPGSLIVKKFRGETLVVKVLDDAFEYNGQRYGSLSAIAQEITGTKWNGFAFFQLTKENTNGRR